MSEESEDIEEIGTEAESEFEIKMFMLRENCISQLHYA